MPATPRIRRPDPLNLVSYADLRPSLRSGDLGIVSGNGIVANIIRQKTNSDYSHVFECGLCSGVWMIAESTEPESRVVCLSSQVRALSGQIDLYRLLPEVAAPIDFNAAWQWMLRASGVNYPEMMIVHDWLELLRRHSPEEHYPNSDVPETRRVCSGLVHADLRVNGMVPWKPNDCDVYPADGARPEVSQYLCTPIYP